MEAIARLRNAKGSPRKARLVIDQIRNKDVNEALNLLRFSEKFVSRRIEKLVESAISNWANKNEGMRPEDSELYVKACYVDGGPVLKRFRPAPFGRAHRIRKRTCHITVVVDSRLPLQIEQADEVEEIQENEA